jgi:hypothetical protein
MNLRGLGRPRPVDNFVENLPFNGLKVPRRAVSIGNRSHWQDIKSMQINEMIAFYSAVRLIWRNAAGPSRHVDTFDDERRRWTPMASRSIVCPASHRYSLA